MDRVPQYYPLLPSGITIEIRDENHARDVMNSIRAAGFTLTMRDPAAD